MSKVSVIIPARNELFLGQTVNDLLVKASGDVEVIAVLDGYWPNPPLTDDKRLIQLHRGIAQGMRAAINGAANIARGDYLMKCDAHCMFADGYDEVLKADCADNWVVIPGRYSLDVEKWEIEKNGKLRRDYHYLCYPDPNKGADVGMHGVEWWDRCRQRSAPEYDIDDEMSSQGSCWFMTKTHFDDHLHGLSEVGYGTFAQEFQEIGNKTWLGGGAVKINKKTWYAHLHKGKKYGRMYEQSRSELIPRINWSARYWMNNEWKDRVHDFEWLVEKFWPVPSWPEDRGLWVAP
jgi:glycosyltransferase involved in cell wall biosynthesis